MKKCNCARSWDEPGEKWYPRRLLDLEELRTHSEDLEKAKIRLVESDECLFLKATNHDGCLSPSNRQTDRYVTLSHCWGKQRPGGMLKLTFSTESDFKKSGIELRELPKTFRDAVVFASRLERVRYMWIDSLCIRQPMPPDTVEEEQLRDWFEQSRHMGSVYRRAFLNISATASSDGHKGLLFDRHSERVWEDSVNVYYPEAHPYISKKSSTAEVGDYKRCMVVDVSAWDDLVELAPVNQRGWVFQERLLAPRVLHFCRNQLAWECSDFSTTESQPNLNLPLKIHREGVYQEGHFKHLTSGVGHVFREARLRGMPDPDEHVKDLYIYELWKRVVESYSRTRLTKFRDKLIALAGIAKLFRDNLFTAESKPNYIAGLWDMHVESQLIWYVNDVYKGDCVFDSPAKRHPESGPSFSWAAIDSPHGVTYGDVTDFASPYEDTAEELLFRVLHHSITLADPKNPFGMVNTGHLLLAPRHLRQIEIYKLPPSRGLPYEWRLKLDPQPPQPIEHVNILLDAPDTDTDIFVEDAQIYCMPAAYGERTIRQGDRYLICLLLKYEKEISFPSPTTVTTMTPGVYEQKEGHRYRMFRRIGITKISSMDEWGQSAVKEVHTREVICLC